MYHRYLYSVTRLKQNENEPIKSIFCKKIIFQYALFHDYHILYETVARVNVNLMTQLNEEKGYQEI